MWKSLIADNPFLESIADWVFDDYKPRLGAMKIRLRPESDEPYMLACVVSQAPLSNMYGKFDFGLVGGVYADSVLNRDRTMLIGLAEGASLENLVQTYVPVAYLKKRLRHLTGLNELAHMDLRGELYPREKEPSDGEKIGRIGNYDQQMEQIEELLQKAKSKTTNRKSR